VGAAKRPSGVFPPEEGVKEGNQNFWGARTFFVSAQGRAWGSGTGREFFLRRPGGGNNRRLFFGLDRRFFFFRFCFLPGALGFRVGQSDSAKGLGKNPGLFWDPPPPGRLGKKKGCVFRGVGFFFPGGMETVGP